MPKSSRLFLFCLLTGILAGGGGCKKPAPLAPPEAPQSAAVGTEPQTIAAGETAIALNDELRRTLFTSYHISKGHPLEEGETDMSPESICMAKKVFASEAEYDMAKAQGFGVVDADPVWVREKPTNLEPIFAHAGIGALDKERFRRFFRVDDLSEEDLAFINANKEALAAAFNATSADNNFEESCAQLFADGRLLRAASVEADNETAFQLRETRVVRGIRQTRVTRVRDQKYCVKPRHNRCEKTATRRVYKNEWVPDNKRVGDFREAEKKKGPYARCLAYGGREACAERRLCTGTEKEGICTK